MATDLVADPRRHRPDRAGLRKALLACGVLYPLAYLVANDVMAATTYDGYSRVDQAISELSGTRAPSRGLLTAMLPVFTVLTVGFGIGVWRAAERSRPLRAAGGLLIAQGLMFPVWRKLPLSGSRTCLDSLEFGRRPKMSPELARLPARRSGRRTGRHG